MDPTGGHRRHLIARLDAEADRLTIDVDTAVDQPIGPVYFRALIGGVPAGGSFVEAVPAPLIRPVTRGQIPAGGRI